MIRTSTLGKYAERRLSGVRFLYGTFGTCLGALYESTAYVRR